MIGFEEKTYGVWYFLFLEYLNIYKIKVYLYVLQQMRFHLMDAICINNIEFIIIDKIK